MRYCARLKAKKDKAVKQLFSKEENEQIPIHSTFKTNNPEIAYSSFVRCRSVMV